MAVKVSIDRKALYALVTLEFDDGGVTRQAMLTMRKDIKKDDPIIKAFERRVLHQPRKITKP